MHHEEAFTITFLHYRRMKKIAETHGSDIDVFWSWFEEHTPGTACSSLPFWDFFRHICQNWSTDGVLDVWSRITTVSVRLCTWLFMTQTTHQFKLCHLWKEWNPKRKKYDMTALPLSFASSVAFPPHRFSLVLLHVQNRLLITLPLFYLP